MYKMIQCKTCIGSVGMREIVAGNLYKVLDSYKMYESCIDELERQLLIALSEHNYISRMGRSDCLRVSTYFGEMFFEYKAALLLYRALTYMDKDIISNFCDDILNSLGDFYLEEAEK